MSREVARAIAEDRLRELRRHSYRELIELLGQVSCDSIDGPDGEEYQVEIEARWDSKTGGDVRVIVAIDGGGVSTFRPLMEDFIMSADGSFTGEK
jgi:hypothetical protein